MLTLAWVPSGRITCAFSVDADEGFGIKFPHGTNGAKAKAVPPAPRSLRKSLLESGLLFSLSCPDM